MKNNYNFEADYILKSPTDNCYLVYKYKKKFIHGICFYKEESQEYYIIILNDIFNHASLSSISIPISSLNKKYYIMFGDKYIQDFYPKIYNKLQKKKKLVYYRDNQEEQNSEEYRKF